MKRFFLTAALVISGSIPSGAHASTWLRMGGPASKPVGHYEYCKSHRSDCRAHGGAGRLASSRMSVLRSVNLHVNRSVKEMSDWDHYGKREVWRLPVNKAGDCEDYALEKRAELMRRGYAASDLLIAVGRRHGEPHAVLVVRTDQGDFVLDNMTDDVLPAAKTRVRISKIQSPKNSAEWVRVTGLTKDVAGL